MLAVAARTHGFIKTHTKRRPGGEGGTTGALRSPRLLLCFGGGATGLTPNVARYGEHRLNKPLVNALLVAGPLR
jgi:hypothetical protein